MKRGVILCCIACLYSLASAAGEADQSETPPNASSPEVLKALEPLRGEIKALIIQEGNDDKVPAKLEGFLKSPDLTVEMKQRAILDFLLAYHLHRRNIDECHKIIEQVIQMKPDSGEAKLAHTRREQINALNNRIH